MFDPDLWLRQQLWAQLWRGPGAVSAYWSIAVQLVCVGLSAGGDTGCKNALASDLDDIVRFYSRRSAARRGDGRRVRDAAITRDRRAVRDARGHGFRPRVYARLLHSHSQARHQEGRMIQNLQTIGLSSASTCAVTRCWRYSSAVEFSSGLRHNA